MKLEVGMYVRTKFGISKIIEDGNVKVIKSDNEETHDVDKNGRHYPTQFRDYIWTSDVIKASHNIIELIEEKDLVEIEYFSLRYEERVTRLFEVTFKKAGHINLDNAKCQFMLLNNDWSDNDKDFEPIIKSIVTKEQFESMEYKV